MSPLITYDHATIVHATQAEAFHDFTWEIREGETWAIVGPVGSGNSTLAETILGRHRLTVGSVAWPFREKLMRQGHTIKGPSDVIRLVPPRNCRHGSLTPANTIGGD